MNKAKMKLTFRTIRVVGKIVLAVNLTIISAQATSLYTVAEFPVSSFTENTFGFSSTGPAQTFTALLGGELQDISVALAQNGSILPSHVIVELRGTTAGTPSSFILASASINGNLLAGVDPGSPVMLSADFSSYHIHLGSGTVYAFSLRTDDGHSAYACGSDFYIVHNYLGGMLFNPSGTTWSPQSLYDINFKVTAVPEPAAPALIVMGSLAILFRSQRKATVLLFTA
jgi:hypothetical protein